GTPDPARRRIVGVGKPHGPDEVRLERGLDRGLDLDDLARNPGDLGAGGLREKRPDRAAARGVADVARNRGVARWDEADHERVRRVDVIPERPREADRVESLDRR